MDTLTSLYFLVLILNDYSDYFGKLNCFTKVLDEKRPSEISF